MIYIESFGKPEIAFTSDLMTQHTAFLVEVKTILNRLIESNQELFRRPAEVRIKSLPSIIRKLNGDGVSVENIISGISKLDDLAGARLTIATKDQFDEVDQLLRKALRIGKVVCKKKWGVTMNSSGYAANHYVLTCLKLPSIRCEIQVRTLTQDLWAVFTHYESYKSDDELNEIRESEIVNYSRLMDVSDHYAILIRKRKIDEADEIHLNACKTHNRQGTPLTVAFLKELIWNISTSGSTDTQKNFIEKVDTIKLCEFLKSVHKLNLFTEQDLTAVIEHETPWRMLAEKVAAKSPIKVPPQNITKTRITRSCNRISTYLQDTGLKNQKELRNIVKVEVEEMLQSIDDHFQSNPEMDVMTALEILCDLQHKYHQDYFSQNPRSAFIDYLEFHVHQWKKEIEQAEALNF